MMMNKMCNWTESREGQLALAGVMTLIGIHQFDFHSEWPLIGFFSKSKFGSMTLPVVGVTPLQALGAVATVGGACLLTSCCLPRGMMEMNEAEWW
jgi:hypothetical protein